MKKYLFIVLLVGVWSCDAIKKAETIVPTKIKGKGMYVLKLKNLSLYKKGWKRLEYSENGAKRNKLEN